MDVEWTNDLVVRLMKEYRKRPELWDSANEMYRLQTAKYEAWSDLASLFECDIADLRKKLNSIFASHRREKAKVRCGGKSTWFLYPYMKFLPTHLDNDNNTEAIIANPNSQKRRSQQLQKEEQCSEDDNQDDAQNSIHEEIIIKEEPVTETFSKTNKKIRHGKPRLKKPLKRRQFRDTSSTNRLDRRILETLRTLRSSDMMRKKDECDSFGEYIADSLRKHDERTQSMIKQAINNILFEQEMKKFSVGQYAVVISEIDENPLILGDSDSTGK